MSEEFNDPALKTALKTLYAAERAPASLRGRILDLTSAPPLPSPVSLPFWRRPMFRLVAALILFAFAGFSYRMIVGPERPAIAQASIPPAILAAMIQTHEICCSHSDHHHLAGLPRDDFPRLGRLISDKVSQPVLAADLAADGWEFRGAAICTVADQKTAHLIFTRGAQQLSIFSLPASACHASIDEPCCHEADGHLVAAIAKAGGVHCIVARCPKGALELPEIASLLTRYKDQVVPVQLASHTVPAPDTPFD